MTEEAAAEGKPVGCAAPARRQPAYDPAFIALNRDMEAKFLRGAISFNSFDWHLRHIYGV